MGKASKKRRNRSKNKGQSRSGCGGPSALAAADNVNTSSGILGRIRHGDPRVRLGALSALSATSLSADVLSSQSSSQNQSSSAKKKNAISDGLLKAASERTLDPDLPVAINAAGCISNYAQFSVDVEEDAQAVDGGNARSSVILAGIGEVLLGRIDKCRADIGQLGQELAEAKQATAAEAESVPTPVATPDHVDEESEMMATDESKKKKKKGKANTKPAQASKVDKLMRSLEQHFTLTNLCLTALSGLVERSPVALERLTAAKATSLVDGTVGMLSLAGQFLSNTTTSSGPDGAAPSAPILDEGTTRESSSVATSSARCLHSALDENLSLLRTLLNQPTSMQILAATMENGTMPSLARLHCAGCLVTVRNLLPRCTSSDEEQKLVEMDGVITTKVLALLTQYLVYHPDIASALSARMVQAEKDMKKEMEDAKMEREVEKEVEDRGESARSIARRQKAAKVEREEEKKKRREGVEGMEEDAIAAAAAGAAAQKDEEAGGNEGDDNKEESAEDVYDKAVEAWRSSCLPLKLAVEVTANLCAGSGGGGEQLMSNEGDDDDDEMMWDSDDEANLMAGASGNYTGAGQTQNNPRDEALLAEVVRMNIPDRVVEVLSAVMSSSSMNSNDASLPDVVAEDLSELLSKCGACAANAVGSVSGWAETPEHSTKLWSALSTLANKSVGMQGYSVAGNSAVASIMLSLLRNRPALVSSIGEEDLKTILGQLHLQGGERADIRRDAVAMLGILCSAPHSDAVNATVCDAFLQVLARDDERVAVMAELLNVLMDMYSADETDEGNHEAIFKQKNVLGAFQHVLPIFKRKISLERSLAVAEDVEMWKETALNASRFIKYKKGHA